MHMLDKFIIISRLLQNVNRMNDDFKKGRREYNNRIDYEHFEERLADLKNMSSKTFNKIDPSLRTKIMKRGVSLLLNTNAGYDTEYNNDEDDSIRNIQVSAQLAVSSNIVLRIPLVIEYDYGGVETLRGGFYKQSKSSKCVDYKGILSELRSKVNELRRVKFGISDYSLSEIVKELKNRGIPYSESLDSGYISFMFPRSAIRT